MSNPDFRKPRVPIRKPPEVKMFGISDDADAKLRQKLLDGINAGANRPSRHPGTKHGQGAAKRGADGGFKPVPPSGQKPSSISPTGDDSSSMVSAMAARLRHTEQAMAKLRDQCRDKDRVIFDLQREVAELQGQPSRPRSAPDSPAHGRKPRADVTLLKEANARLRRQVEEMEKFLTDYGLKWVGSSAALHESDDKSEGNSKEILMKGEWNQKESLPKTGVEALGFDIDVEKMKKNVNELNHLVNSSGRRVEARGGVSKLEKAPQVFVGLYSNGVLVMNGPLRPWNMRETKLLMRDLMDGYFPYEFKESHPDGILLDFHAHLDTPWGGPHASFHAFNGQGHRLGGANAQSLSEKPSKAEELKEIRAMRGGGVDANSLLRKLPDNVIRDGKVIPIKGDIAARIQGVKEISSSNQAAAAAAAAADSRVQKADSIPEASVPAQRDGVRKNLAATIEMHKEQDRRPEEVSDTGANSEDGRLAEIVVRKPHDNSSFKLRLPYSYTVGQLRQRVAKELGKLSFELRTPLPARALTDDKETMEEAELVPNAVLVVKLGKS